jgi:hypothetical protein
VESSCFIQNDKSITIIKNSRRVTAGLWQCITAYYLGSSKPAGDLKMMARCVALLATATRQVLDIVAGRYDDGERALFQCSLTSSCRCAFNLLQCIHRMHFYEVPLWRC